MKKIASLLTLLLLTISGFTQTTRILPVKDTIDFNNQFDFDMHFLALEGTYKGKVGPRTMLGFSLSTGLLSRLALMGNNSDRTYFELVKFKILCDYSWNKNFHTHLGASYAAGLSSGNSFPFSGGVLRGIEVGVFHKVGIIELGVEPALIFFDEEKGVLTTSLLIIKIPINRW